MSPNTFAFAQTGDINYKYAKMVFSPGAERRNFSKRAFGKLGQGSLRGSIFALCASAIGSGVLSLPYVLRLNGWVMGLLLILIGGFGNKILLIYSAAGWSLFMIAESAIKSNVKNFSKLANFVGGLKLERFLQINILIYLWGSCISY